MDIDPSQNSFPLHGSSSSCLPHTGVSSPNAAEAVVDDDEASRQCSDRLSPLPETETSG